jgi:hypothetical protein
MSLLNDLTIRTNKLIDELEDDTDESKTQEFVENFWKLRDALQDAKDSSFGKEKSTIEELLKLLNRKGKENDLKPY